jgi:hypothetical protein
MKKLKYAIFTILLLMSCIILYSFKSAYKSNFTQIFYKEEVLSSIVLLNEEDERQLSEVDKLWLQLKAEKKSVSITSEGDNISMEEEVIPSQFVENEDNQYAEQVIKTVTTNGKVTYTSRNGKEQTEEATPLTPEYIELIRFNILGNPEKLNEIFEKAKEEGAEIESLEDGMVKITTNTDGYKYSQVYNKELGRIEHSELFRNENLIEVQNYYYDEHNILNTKENEFYDTVPLTDVKCKFVTTTFYNDVKIN